MPLRLGVAFEALVATASFAEAEADAGTRPTQTALGWLVRMIGRYDVTIYSVKRAPPQNYADLIQGWLFQHFRSYFHRHDHPAADRDALAMMERLTVRRGRPMAEPLDLCFEMGAFRRETGDWPTEEDLDAAWVALTDAPEA